MIDLKETILRGVAFSDTLAEVTDATTDRTTRG
jgi:hypothetical protein